MNQNDFPTNHTPSAKRKTTISIAGLLFVLLIICIIVFISYSNDQPNQNNLNTQETESSYQNDLILFEKIQENLNSDKESDWRTIQKDINAIQSKKVQSKVSTSMINDIEEKVYTKILYNTLLKLENDINSEFSTSDTTCVFDSFYYRVTDPIDIDHLMSLPESSAIAGVLTEGFTLNGDMCISKSNATYNTSAPSYYAQLDTFYVHPLQDAVKNNKSGGFVVQYKNASGDNMYRFHSCDFNIKATYAFGKLKLGFVDNSGQNFVYSFTMDDLDSLTACDSQ